MSESLAEMVALPGDPDLDCHLTGLRLSSVISADTSAFDAECLLVFDTTAATGFWVTGGERMYPDRVTEFTITFGIQMDEGYAHLAGLIVERLRSWAETWVPVEMTAAPGKCTLLRGPADSVLVPRGSGGVSDARRP